MKYPVIITGWQTREEYRTICDRILENGYKLDWIDSKRNWGVMFDTEEEAVLFKLTYL